MCRVSRWGAWAVMMVLCVAGLHAAEPVYIGSGAKIYAMAADQPQLTAMMLDGSGNIIRDSSNYPILLDPYIDTGASGFVISSLTARGFTTLDIFGDPTFVQGLGIDGTHGEFIGHYTDYGIGGPEVGDVTRTSNPFGILIRNGTPLEATFDPETFEIILPDIIPSEFANQGAYSFWVRRQEGYGERTQFLGMDVDVSPLNVVGMPVIRQNVMVMDPTTIAVSDDGLSVTRMSTQLLPKNSPLPATNLTFNLALVDFVNPVAAGETAGSNFKNPVFQHVTISNITESQQVVSSTNNVWLFDTGSIASMITFAKATEIGLIDANVYPTYASFMDAFTGVTLPIAGIGSITDATYAPLLELPEVRIPSADGADIVWRNVDVLVLDINVGQAAPFDGVLGMNMLMPASTVDMATLEELGSNPGYFDKIIFNTIGDSRATLSLLYNPGIDQSSTWNVNAGGPWSVAASWTLGAPGGETMEAVFGNIITAPKSITLDTDVTLGKIVFDSAIKYTLAGSGKLTLGGMAVVQTLIGTHEISAPISGSLGLMKTGAGTLILSGSNTIVGPVNVSEGELQVARLNEAANPSVTVAAGASLVADRIRGNTLTVGGAVRMRSSSGTSVVDTLTLAGSTDSWTGKLDLGNSGIVIKSGNEATVSNQIASALYGPDLWTGNGITASAAAAAPDTKEVAVLTNGEAGSPYFTEFMGDTGLTGGEVLVRLTWAGDTDLSGVVDGDDLSMFIDGYYGVGSGWLYGDFDYSGTVDGDDLSMFINGYYGQGGPLGEVSTAQVPEPATLALLTLGGLALLRRRRHADLVQGSQGPRWDRDALARLPSLKILEATGTDGRPVDQPGRVCKSPYPNRAQRARGKRGVF